MKDADTPEVPVIVELTLRFKAAAVAAEQREGENRVVLRRSVEQVDLALAETSGAVVVAFQGC